MAHEEHDDFGGLHRDLAATGAEMNRRGLLRLAAGFGAGFGAVQLLGCGGSSPTAPTTTANTDTGSTPTGTAGATCATIPQETAGPFPADGSNGPTVLGATGVVRSDIRSSFAGLSGTADGVPLSIVLTIVSASTCSPLAGRAVYLWHCDRLGRYSLYSSGATNQNYLRGVQEADGSGRVTFTSIYPGVLFRALAAHPLRGVPEPLGRNQRREPDCDVADCPAQGDLRPRLRNVRLRDERSNLSQVSLATDNVFSDGSALELATITGSVQSGFTAALTVAV